MTVSELVAAAQKGLDYDNVRARLEQAQQSAPAVQLVERYAAANGMTVEQYLQFANQGFEHRAADRNSQQRRAVAEVNVADNRQVSQFTFGVDNKLQLLAADFGPFLKPPENQSFDICKIRLLSDGYSRSD